MPLGHIFFAAGRCGGAVHQHGCLAPGKGPECPARRQRQLGLYTISHGCAPGRRRCGLFSIRLCCALCEPRFARQTARFSGHVPCCHRAGLPGRCGGRDARRLQAPAGRCPPVGRSRQRHCLGHAGKLAAGQGPCAGVCLCIGHHGQPAPAACLCAEQPVEGRGPAPQAACRPDARFENTTHRHQRQRRTSVRRRPARAAAGTGTGHCAKRPARAAVCRFPARCGRAGSTEGRTGRNACRPAFGRPVQRRAGALHKSRAAL